MKISTILDQIDVGAMALPQFQRGYVWNRDQVRKLMSSLYKRHPIGELLIWVAKTENAKTRGKGHLQPGSIELLLDGQQRITSIYGIVRGIAPKFFEGNLNAFTSLYFNLDDENFEFYAAPKMKGSPIWVDVTNVMKLGVGEFITPFTTKPEYKDKLPVYITRLSKLHDIKDVELHIEQVTGEDKTVDVVVEIFNQVNSGGTKLSKGDLALARVCASWPEARDHMRVLLNRWSTYGYNGFRLDWLLRVINADITGDAYFTALRDVDVPQFKAGLIESERLIDKTLNQISGRLGLDHATVLGSIFAFPIMIRYLKMNDGKLKDYREWDKLLYWYVHTLLWGRYAGSTESMLSQDLNILRSSKDPLEELIGILRKNRGGDLKLKPNDFISWSAGSRFYPLLYLMTRTSHAKDWETGIELSNHLLGKINRLQVHHILPKAVLYKFGYNKTQVNSIANFTFLTQETNLAVTDRLSEEYFPYYEKKQPGAIESHWIPMDKELWKPEKYLDFLEARRVLLAKSANQLLDGLYAGTEPSPENLDSVIEKQIPIIPGHIEDELEDEIINECNGWMIKHDLPEGEYMYELVDPKSGESLAMLDLAWPKGVQEEFSQPVALIIGEDSTVIEIASKVGYRCFTSSDDFKRYISSEIMVSNNIV